MPHCADQQGKAQGQVNGSVTSLFTMCDISHGSPLPGPPGDREIAVTVPGILIP